MKSALMLGVNPSATREENDYYATEPRAIELALPFFEKIGLNDNLWECSCGEGHISQVLEDNFYNVYSSDLIDRGYGDVKDFLKETNVFNGDIITNPPFKLAQEFVEHGFELIEDGNKIVLFLKIQFLESKKRKEMFEKYPLKHLAVYSERVICAKNGDFEKYKSATLCYAWYVFEKGYKGEPTLSWI